MIDWDYWPYLWVVHRFGAVCLIDAFGRVYSTRQATLGL